MNGTHPPHSQPKEGVGSALFLALKLAWNLGYLIAIPAFTFGFGGAYLDRYAGTSPFFLLLGFAVALTISFIGVRRKVKEILGENPKSQALSSK